MERGAPNSLSAAPRPADVRALLSPEEVARQCGLSRRAVYRAVERGELRASRLCSRIRIRASDVEEWVDESRIEPPSAPARSLRRPPSTSADGLRRLLADS
jgi:excisionase family DNA binding protein